MVLAPYRKWAAQRGEIDSYVNARAFVEKKAQKAASDALVLLVSLRIDFGKQRVQLQQSLIAALAEKLAGAAMAAIEVIARAS